jgi:adenosylhomocysteine nucleosidase
MRVGFLAPMPSELRPITRALGLERAAGDDVYRGALGDIEVVAVRTGMGTASAAGATERIIDDEKVDHVVVAGITGGVDDRYDIGHVLQPQLVIHGDAGTEHRPVPIGPIAPSGVLWTSNEFSVEPKRIAALVGRGVTCLDMETAAIGAVCEARDVPWSAFRSVSDRVIDGLVDDGLFALANPDGTPNLGNVLKYVARHPWRIPRLIRVGRDANKATEAAAQAAIAAVRTLR